MKIKKYSVSIPLSGKVYDLARKCQKVIYEGMSINSSYVNDSVLHINLISGTTEKIDKIISDIKKIKINKENNHSKLIGLGVLLTPDPLIYLRFTNSVFLKDIRYFLFKKTITFWDSLTDTVKDDLWIPKSTLAFKDFALTDLNKALVAVKDIELKLIMEINELSIIEFTDFEHEIERIKI